MEASTGPVLRVWRSAPSVVCGRHQIPCMEANRIEAARRGVPVLRRMSGGGTVYHDFGNLNYTILSGPEKGLGIDFLRMMAPVVAALGALGVPAEHLGRGDVRLLGKKISGNAAHLHKGRLLHHGTLLFSADLDTLEALLEVPEGRVHSKSIRSVRAKVVNISEACPGLFPEFEAFADAFGAELAAELGLEGEIPRAFTPDEVATIELLAAKYRSLEWNVGASPDYTAQCRGGFEAAVKDGRIAVLTGTGTGGWPQGLKDVLAGCFHDPESIARGIASFGNVAALPSPADFFP